MKRAWLLTMSLLAACGDSDSAPAVDAPGASDLPSYVVPGEEQLAAITIDRTTGVFYVDSAASGKLYRGTAGAQSETTLDLLADLTGAGLAGGGHLALAPDGTRLYVLSGFGQTPRLTVVDVAARSVLRTVDIPVSGGSGFASVQDIAVTADGAKAYITNPFDNVIHVIDLQTFATSAFPISSEFPHIADANRGFINATGVAIAEDGTHLLVVHIIDKHVYRISLAAADLGQAQQIDTQPYNVSGNGLWLDADNSLLEAAGDELRVYRFALDPTSTTGTLTTRYASPAIQQGMQYAVAFGDRVLVLGGNGVALGGGAPGGGSGSGTPQALIDACNGKQPGDACSAMLGTMTITSTCAQLGASLACNPGSTTGGADAGTSNPVYPVKVLQLAR